MARGRALAQPPAIGADLRDRAIAHYLNRHGGVLESDYRELGDLVEIRTVEDEHQKEIERYFGVEGAAANLLAIPEGESRSFEHGGVAETPLESEAVFGLPYRSDIEYTARRAGDLVIVTGRAVHGIDAEVSADSMEKGAKGLYEIAEQGRAAQPFMWKVQGTQDFRVIYRIRRDREGAFIEPVDKIDFGKIR